MYRKSIYLSFALIVLVLGGVFCFRAIHRYKAFQQTLSKADVIIRQELKAPVPVNPVLAWNEPIPDGLICYVGQTDCHLQMIVTDERGVKDIYCTESKLHSRIIDCRTTGDGIGFRVLTLSVDPSRLSAPVPRQRITIRADSNSEFPPSHLERAVSFSVVPVAQAKAPVRPRKLLQVEQVYSGDCASLGIVFNDAGSYIYHGGTFKKAEAICHQLSSTYVWDHHSVFVQSCSSAGENSSRIVYGFRCREAMH